MNTGVRLGQRKALWIVIVLNAALAVGFPVTGPAADSSSLIANAGVGIAVAGIAVKGGVEILRDAHRETHEDERADADDDGTDAGPATEPRDPAR